MQGRRFRFSGLEPSPWSGRSSGASRWRSRGTSSLPARAGEGAEEGDGVFRVSAPLDLEMEVGPCDPAGGAREPDDRTPFESLAGDDMDLGEVGVQRTGTAPVIDDHDAAVPGKGAREMDATGGHGADGRSGGHGNVDAAVDTDVESVAADPEGGGHWPIHRPARHGAAGGEQEGRQGGEVQSHASGKLSAVGGIRNAGDADTAGGLGEPGNGKSEDPGNGNTRKPEIGNRKDRKSEHPENRKPERPETGTPGNRKSERPEIGTPGNRKLEVGSGKRGGSYEPRNGGTHREAARFLHGAA
jgi:hypothetical protein